jgi:acyl-CoA synthetase (AMP-forming)/AMP-acid ligase II
LIKAARWLAEERPDQTLFRFIKLDAAALELTNAELWDRACRLAAWLDAQGVGPDQVVGINLPYNEEIIPVFLGTMLLGAVPAIFPHASDKADSATYRQRLDSLLESSGAARMLVPAVAHGERKEVASAAGERLLPLPSLEEISGLALSARRLEPDAIAMLQYSSGTTGRQKGIELSQRSILDHHQSLYRALDLQANDRVVSWLPLHHDMGVISAVFFPLLAGLPATLMETLDWVRSPAMLLKTITQERSTLCWMPNFAFNHTLRSLRRGDAGGLDLSSMRRWFNASEPVRESSIQAFAEYFAPFGLNADALGTGYGLAEIGAVSLTQDGKRARVDYIDRRQLQELGRAVPAQEATAMSVVSCGRLVPGVQLQIRDEHDQVLPERTVGQIHVQSPSMFNGYYGRPDLTANALAGGWLRTGDLGYVAAGELYVTGRIKDLMIVAGKNIYPEDVEAVSNETPGVYPGRSAAFSVPDETLGSEGIVLVYEARSPLSKEAQFELERELRRRVVQELDVTLHVVQLVPRGWVQKASSGKIARNANKQKYLAPTADGRDDSAG